MPVTISEQRPPVDTYIPPNKRWTREERTIIVNAGILEPERYELIEGQLIERVRKDIRHTRVWSSCASGFGVTSTVQGLSIDVAPEDHSTSDPEPDVVVLSRSIEEFSEQPGPEDLRLVVEVSDSKMLYFDLTTKAALYARAAILEYWIIDIEGRRVIVHREPCDGHYCSILAYSEDELVATLAAPEAQVRVGDLL